MTETMLFQLFQSVLAIGFAIALYMIFYRRTRADSFREDMFTIRDEMFDYLWQNNLSFESPSYMLLRDSLNGAIRVGDQLNILVFVQTVGEVVARGENRRLSETISEVRDPIHRAYFEKVQERIALRIMKYLFLEGLAGLLFNPILAIAGSLEYISKLKERWALRPAQKCTYELAAFGRFDSPEGRAMGRSGLLLRRS
jgi:hypothetical protein